MADNTNTTYIDVEVRAKGVQQQLAELTATIARLKLQQSDLTKEQKRLIKEQQQVQRAQQELTQALANGAISAEAYQQQSAALAEQLELLRHAEADNAYELAGIATELSTASAAMAETKREAKQLSTEMDGSLNAMREQLKLLLKDFDALPAAERQAAGGQELKKKIQDLTAAISEQERETGRFQRNVGNYQSIWEASADKIDGFGKVLAKIFGENSVITQSAKRVAGFGRTLGDMSNNAPQAASGMQATAQAATAVGDATQTAQRRTIGFTQSQQQAGAAARGTAAAETATATATQAVGTAAKGAAASIKGMTMAALKFLATPIGAILGAIAAAVAIVVAGFMKLRDAIKRSDDAGTAIDSLKGRFKVLGDVVGKVFNAIVKALVPVIEGISKVAGAILNLIPGVRDLADAEEQQVRILDELQDRQRAYQLATAANAKEQAKLKLIYADSTKSAKEREDALLKAVEIEKEEARERLRLAKMELQIEQAKLRASGDTSDAAKDRLTQLQAAVMQAEAALIEAEAGATKKLSTLRRQQQQEAKQAADERKRMAEQAAKEAEERAKRLQDLYKANKDARLAMVRDEYARTHLLAKTAYQRERAELQKQLEAQQALVKKYQSNTASEQYQNALKQADALAEALKLKAEGYAAAIVELARRREAELAELQQSNEQLRIEMMEEGRAKTIAAYELQSRQIDQQQGEERESYRQHLQELDKLRKEGLIAEEEYQRQRDQLAVEHLDKEERTELQRQKAQQERAKALAAINLQEASKALSEINKAYADAVKEADKTDYQAQSMALDAKKEALQALYNSLAEMSEEQASDTFGTLEAWRDKVAEVADAYKAAGEAITKHNDTIAKSTQDAIIKATTAVASLASTMANYYGEQVERIIGDNEQLTESQKADALRNVEAQYHSTMAGIVLQQASGIASTYAAGAKAMAETVGGPAVKIASMVAVIASGLSSLLSGIMQAKTATQSYQDQRAKIAAMAQGGYVQGPGTATSDSIPARLSNGESVLTARATAAHYDVLSRWNVEGGGRPFPQALPVPPTYHFATGGVAIDYAGLAEILRTAVADVQPVVSVKEITRTINRVQVKERLTR